MTTFRSCHLIVNRKLPNDRRHVLDFIDAGFVLVGRYFYSVFFLNGFYPQTPTFFLSIMLILGKH